MYLIVDTTNYIPGFIMATIQIRVDDNMKSAADTLFSNLGLDTSTAIRMFLSAALAKDGMPFAVKRRKPNADLLEAIHDTRNRRNLHGPYKTSEEAVAAMLKDWCMLEIEFTNKMKRDVKLMQLTGDLKDFRECHIEPNWLLIYQIIENKLILSASGTGTHSDLFS